MRANKVAVQIFIYSMEKSLEHIYERTGEIPTLIRNVCINELNINKDYAFKTPIKYGITINFTDNDIINLLKEKSDYYIEHKIYNKDNIIYSEIYIRDIHYYERNQQEINYSALCDSDAFIRNPEIYFDNDYISMHWCPNFKVKNDNNYSINDMQWYNKVEGYLLLHKIRRK
jgi:hypothetical protein